MKAVIFIFISFVLLVGIFLVSNTKNEKEMSCRASLSEYNFIDSAKYSPYDKEPDIVDAELDSLLSRARERINCEQTDNSRTLSFTPNGNSNWSTRRVGEFWIGHIAIDRITSDIQAYTRTGNWEVFEFELFNDIDLRNDSMRVEFKIRQNGSIAWTKIVESSIENTDFEDFFIAQINDWNFRAMDSEEIPDGKVFIQHTFYFGKFEFDESSRCSWLRLRLSQN